MSKLINDIERINGVVVKDKAYGLRTYRTNFQLWLTGRDDDVENISVDEKYENRNEIKEDLEYNSSVFKKLSQSDKQDLINTLAISYLK